MADPLITDSRHPLYTAYDYSKFRLTYSGGDRFIEAYLQKYDSREETEDFKRRKETTYNPGSATEAIDEIIAGIFQRMPEIIREGGTQSYFDAVAGKDGGVDLEGNTMNTFIGQKLLPELLPMSRVGAYVDMPQFNPNSTLAQFNNKNPRPYIYYYKLEDILNWRSVFYSGELIHVAVLLRERRWNFNAAGLPDGDKEVFRLIRLLPQGGVQVQFMEQFNEDGQKKERVLEEYNLTNLNRLPFVMLDIGKSLLNDSANAQVALLNLNSSDISYGLNANFPFYVEGYDPKAENAFGKQGGVSGFDDDGNPVTVTKADSSTAPEAVVGTVHGRRYPMDAKQPNFIHPSPEPLNVSMAKQEQIKVDIRRLLNLALANVAPSRASVESKKVDQQGLEGGLAAIGIELAAAELEIAKLWAMYEGKSVDKISISYPTTYSLKSDEQRMLEADGLQKLKGAAPSRLFQKEVSKQIVRRILEGRVSQDTLIKVLGEVDNANYTISDIEQLAKAIEIGICDATTGSEAAGFNPEIVVKAQAERVQRLAEAALAQSKGAEAASKARGNPDGADDADAEKKTSQNPDTKPPGETGKRGKA